MRLRRYSIRRHLLLPLLSVLMCGAPAAQELEPRSYTNTPVGINFLVAGLGFMRGDVVTDSAQPLENAQIDAWLPVLAYARSLEIAGRSGKLDMVLPTGCLEGSTDYQGEYYERDTCGAGDPSVKLSVNLFGAPALRLAEAPGWRQDLIVGVGLRVGTPLGEYDPEKLLNLGANRWSIKPEVGLSKAWGRITAELIGAVALYTDNDDWYGHRRREQDPLWSMQLHLIYALRNGSWIALNSTGYRGGRTTVDGVRGDDLQENARFGLTFAMPLSRRQTVKLVAGTGVVARSGGDFDSVAIAWQYRWGGGL